MTTNGRIAVLGGGPAGSAAALRLARAGAVVDLYLPVRPGEKPCGGAVPEHVLPRLEGFDPAPLPAVFSPRGLLENAAGGRLELDLQDLRIFRRADLDAALVAAAVAAGARRLPGRAERIERIERLGANGRGEDGRGGARGVRVTLGGEARDYAWAVAADGARGPSRRLVGLAPAGESLGVGGSLSGLDWDRLVLAFPDLVDAYLWIFPRPGGASVGIAYSAGTLSDGAARGVLGRFLDRHLPAGWRSLPGPRYRYPIPVWGPWTAAGAERALADRLLLVGDAAAVADPLTREGIRWGMLSGRWAAECLLADEPERYPERLAMELAPEMERAQRARGLFFEDPVGQWMVGVARHHAGIRGVLADLLACRQPYRGLRGRLFGAALRPFSA